MTSPMLPPSKRRRLQQSSESLAKPFKSPLRSLTANKPPAESHISSEAEPSTQSTTSKIPHHPPRPTTSADVSDVGVNLSAPSTSVSPRRQSRPDNNLTTINLQKEVSRLTRELDTIQQAEKIEASGKDDELQVLVDKWKMASRELAEEAFRTAKDRVNRMGGVGAWRQSIQKRPNGWDDDEAEIQSEDLTDEQREAFEIAREEMLAENAKYGSIASSDKTADREDESFTMDMMLESINIDPRLIGYDKVNQRWED
ncbi:MAG: hypothetical protein Q9227_000299 [Pyrenula ochraceoflavens]